MTGLQLFMLGGGLIGLGLAMGVWYLAPAEPDLADALRRLSPDHKPANSGPSGTGAADRQERVGLWAMTHLPAGVWWHTPTRELALLRIPLARFYGDKLTFAAVGLALPTVISTLFTLMGLSLPWAVPAIGTLVLAVVLWFVPNLNAATEAKLARAEFTRALSAYVELVALERNAGSGTRQAMELAATLGDSWVFSRIGEELARSRWSGQAPWDALHTLADELGLPDLADLADIMRLSGEEGAQVYAALRARSAAMRAAQLSVEHSGANETTDRMVIPGSVLGGVFVVILITPALLRMLS